MAEMKDGLVHTLVSAFHNIANLMKAPVGDAGAIANAKQAASALSGLHPDVLAAYHEAIVAAVTVQPVTVIPVVEPLVDPDYMAKSAAAYKAKEEKPAISEGTKGGARMG